MLTVIFYWGLGIGDWGLGIGDWGLGVLPHLLHLPTGLRITLAQR
ncbi:MAG: hypothetical protein V7L11_33010 [Nostoc sp.]